MYSATNLPIVVTPLFPWSMWAAGKTYCLTDCQICFVWTVFLLVFFYEKDVSLLLEVLPMVKFLLPWLWLDAILKMSPWQINIIISVCWGPEWFNQCLITLYFPLVARLDSIFVSKGSCYFCFLLLALLVYLLWLQFNAIRYQLHLYWGLQRTWMTNFSLSAIRYSPSDQEWVNSQPDKTADKWIEGFALVCNRA